MLFALNAMHAVRTHVRLNPPLFTIECVKLDTQSLARPAFRRLFVLQVKIAMRVFHRNRYVRCQAQGPLLRDFAG